MSPRGAIDVSGLSCKRLTVTPIEPKKDWQFDTTRDDIASGVIPANTLEVDMVHVFVDEPMLATIVMDPETDVLLIVALREIDLIDKAFAENHWIPEDKAPAKLPTAFVADWYELLAEETSA